MDIKDVDLFDGGSSEIHGLAAMLQTKPEWLSISRTSRRKRQCPFGVFCRAWQTGSKICNAYEIRMQFEEGSEDA